jgi:hypothetical protein
VSKKDDLCYFPTERLCSLKDVLPDEFMPKNQHEITRQEIITYRKTESGIRRVTFVRSFVNNWHHDSVTEESLG